MQICMQIGLKMEAGDCPTLNMNAMENDLLSHSLNQNVSDDYPAVYGRPRHTVDN